jgi:hypothetical protein
MTPPPIKATAVPVPVRVALGLRNIAYELLRGTIFPDQAADAIDTLAHQLEKWIEANK